jgi:hypothetical protein
MLKNITQEFEDDYSCDESMAKHTSWGIGGCADLFYSPKSREDLVSFLSSIDPNLPITWIEKKLSPLYFWENKTDQHTHQCPKMCVLPWTHRKSNRLQILV